MTSRGFCDYDLRAGVGKICVVARDPGEQEVREGVPLYPGAPAGRIFEDACVEAGIRREDINVLNVSRQRPPSNRFEAHTRESLASEIAYLRETLERLKPKVIVALGNEACHATTPEWPDARSRDDGLYHRGDIKGARDIENRRGYVFDGFFGPTIASVHPAAIARSWTPWRTLLSFDLQRAKEVARDGLVRPTRNVNIVGSDRDARHAVKTLRRYGVLSADIENEPDTSLSCIGFAGQSDSSFVFPKRYAERAKELLEGSSRQIVWVNGIYDLFVLKWRNGWDIRARCDDAMIAWHSCYPEIAGAKEDRKKHRFTRKALSFLASLVTYDPWWKDYNFETPEEQFILNGRDCGTTLDVWKWLQKEMEKVGAKDVYEHERSLMWPCVDMLARGLNVDEALRRERIEALEAELEHASEGANDLVLPLIERASEMLDALGKRHLFEETDPTCICCGHGTKKQMGCWSCAGFESAPTKADMLRKFPTNEKISKEKLAERVLPICHVCCGAPRETRFVVNLNSDTQVKTLLFDVLRAPQRWKRSTTGKSVLTVDEQALKSLRGELG